MSAPLVRLPGTKRLFSRLHAEGAAPAFSDEVAERALMVLSGAYLCFAGALLTGVWLALPTTPAGADGTGMVLMALSAAAMGSMMLIGGERLPGWTFHCFALGGTLIVTGLIHFSEAQTSAYAFLYLWVALYALNFFTPTKAALHILVIAFAYAAVLAGDLAAGNTQGGVLTAFSEAAPRWTFTVGTLLVAVAFVSMLKDRLDGLVARFADAAREDPLTGLQNRRGFDESFDLEIERAQRAGRQLSLVLGDLDHFKEVNDRLGHPYGDDVLRRTAEMLRATNRRIDVAARVGGEEFAVLLPDTDERGAHVAAERMRRAIRDGFADEPMPLTISFGIASFPTHGDNTDDLMESADQALYTAKDIGRDCTVIFSPGSDGGVTGHARRRRARGEARLASLLTLAESLDTHEHAATVGRYAREIGRELGYPHDGLENLMLAGILHDVGKVGIPGSIVLKTGPLTAAEWEEMRKHPAIGASMLEGVNQPQIAEWVHDHHERPDGLGYPRGLRGDEVSVESRILAVADAYEAMTHDRVYRPALGVGGARRELQQGAGSQFDEEIVGAFLRVLKAEGGAGARGLSIFAR